MVASGRRRRPTAVVIQRNESVRERMRTVNRRSVTSSVIAAVGYDPACRILEVEFRYGGIYRYGEVADNVYREFLAAESHGTYFNAAIRDRYETTRIY